MSQQDMPTPRYYPLDAKTFRQGVLHLRCQFCTAGLAFLTGALAVLYELMLLNVQDRDFRDMLFDYRMTQTGRRNHHVYFLMSDVCTTSPYVVQSYKTGPPYCPPKIHIECSNAQLLAANNTCSEAADLLYSMAGISSNGDVQDCYKASQYSVTVNTVDDGTSSITVSRQSVPISTYGINLGSQEEWGHQLTQAVQDTLKSYSDQWYRDPGQPLSSSLIVDGSAAYLTGRWQNGKSRNIKRFGAWDPALWPWKVRCPDTNYPSSYYLTGSASVQFPRYEDAEQHISRFSLYNSSYPLAMYQRTNASGTITISRLSAVKVRVAMAPTGDACNSWVISSAEPTYSQVWSGQSDAAAAVSESSETVRLEVHDVAEPRPVALPANGGAMYIYIAICMGGIWLFSLAPVPIQLFVVYVNVRRNNGLPPPFYKYMKRYRGWGGS